VRDQARAQGRQFRAVAVSLDWSTREAFAFLEGFGEFDEISVGSSWLNDGALRYIWRDFPAEPEVPQLVVMEREIETEPAVRVRSERLVKRVSAPTTSWPGLDPAHRCKRLRRVEMPRRPGPCAGPSRVWGRRGLSARSRGRRFRAGRRRAETAH
ncbi:MAG TPA: hypothetical protein VHG93_04720, partial [Longimicrobium sp.]|nr:hypothetical protein [Longimicrobium sp.]